MSSTEQDAKHDSVRVACDGAAESAGASATAPALGHPRIFLSFRGEQTVVCPYCSRTFTRPQA